MDDQNPNDPLMTDIANQYVNNKNDFIETAKNYTAKFAASDC